MAERPGHRQQGSRTTVIERVEFADPRDIVGDARRSAREEIKKANTEAKKQDLAQTFINEFNDKSSTATRNSRKLSRENRVDSDYVNVNEKLTRLLEGVRANIVPVPTNSGKTILEQLGQQDLGHYEALHLYGIINKIIEDKSKNYLTFSIPGTTTQTDAEKDFINLTVQNADAAHTLREALHRAAQQGFLNITEDQLKARLEEFNKEVEVVRRQEEKKTEAKINEQISKEEKKALDEKRQLIRQYAETDHKNIRLINAIYDENLFIQYIKDMIYGNNEINENLDYKDDKEGLVKTQSLAIEKQIIQDYHSAHKNKKKQELETKIERGELSLRVDEIEKQAEEYAKQQIDVLKDSGRIIKEVEQRIYQILSNELKLRIVRMVSRLYSIVDKADPTELWQEASSRGATLYYNISTLNKSIQTALTRLSDTDFTQIAEHKDFMKKLNFYKQVDEEFTIEVETKSRYVVPEETPYNKAGEYAVKKEDRAFIRPRTVNVRLAGVADYMTTVLNAVTTEVGVRQFLHDARALPYRETGQTSYWDMMAGFARQHLKSTDVDSLYSLFNGDKILSASRLWDKLNETNFARENWNYRAAAGQLDPDLKLTDVDQKTRDYLKRVYGDLDDWELWRILAVAVGDNFGITVRGITTGALADPPLRDANPTYISYGPKDSVMYQAFNHMAHTNMRFQPEGLFWGNLIFLPVDGTEDYLKHLGEKWDHKILVDEMQKAMNAFAVGRNSKDTGNKIVRFADLSNIGKVGSIYDRGGWRSYYAYEGWFVRDKNNKVDIVESWKALEGIGIEVIKDFIGHIDEFAQDPDFYKDGEANVEKRKKLVMHIYQRYFNEDEDGQKLPFDPDKFNDLFEGLEKETPNTKKAKKGAAPIITRKDNYTDFFKKKVMGRMFFQRIPTKYLRAEVERTRKVSSGRKRAWEEIYEPTPTNKKEDERPHVKELLEIIATIDDDKIIADDELTNEKKKAAYVQAIQDLCAAEVLLREDATKKMKETIDTKGGRLNEVDISDYNLTPKRLEELWEKYNITLIDKDETEYAERGIDWKRDVDGKRKKNALTVLKAVRKFALTADKNEKGNSEFIDNFHDGDKNSNFAMAVEELERSLIPQRSAGETVPQRAFGDIALVEKEVVGNIMGFYQTLFSASIDGKNNFHGIIEKIQKVKDTLEGVHGKDHAHKIAIYMARMAISYYKYDHDAEGVVGRWMSSRHTSLASLMAGGEVGKIWEWDRATIHHFIDDLILRRILPYEPYEFKKTRDETKYYKYETVTKKVVGKDGEERDVTENVLVLKDGKPVEVEELREFKPDFHHFAHQLHEQFLQNNPLLEALKKLAPVALMLFIASLIMTTWQAFKASEGKK